MRDNIQADKEHAHSRSAFVTETVFPVVVSLPVGSKYFGLKLFYQPTLRNVYWQFSLALQHLCSTVDRN